MYRSHSKTTPLEEEAGAALPDPGIDAEMAVGLDEDRAHVRAVMETLPQKERQLLHWLFFEECDKDEVCRRLGHRPELPESAAAPGQTAVQGRIRRVMKRLGTFPH